MTVFQGCRRSFQVSLEFMNVSCLPRGSQVPVVGETYTIRNGTATPTFETLICTMEVLV